MEIATTVDPNAIPHGILQFRNAFSDQLGLKPVGRVRVRSGHDIAGTGFTRDARHRQAYIERRRPVIEARQDMGMNINHGKMKALPKPMRFDIACSLYSYLAEELFDYRQMVRTQAEGTKETL